MDIQWQFPMDCQRHSPTDFSPVSGIFQRIFSFPVDFHWTVLWIFSGIVQRNFTLFDCWRATVCPESGAGGDALGDAAALQRRRQRQRELVAAPPQEVGRVLLSEILLPRIAIQGNVRLI